MKPQATKARRQDMAHQDYAVFQKRLEEQRQHLKGQLEQLRAQRTGEGRREGSPFGKREEEASAAAEFAGLMAAENRILSELADVEYALQKFEQGTYGICERCGEPISWDRLEILPEAKLCVKCKAIQAKEAKR